MPHTNIKFDPFKVNFTSATSEVLPIYIERITEMMVTDEKHSNLLKKKVLNSSSSMGDKSITL